MTQSVLEPRSRTAEPQLQALSPTARLMPLSEDAVLFNAIAAPDAEVEEVDFMNLRLAERDRDAVWLPLRLADDRFNPVVGTLHGTRNLVGFSVHDPYQRSIAKHLGAMSPRARMMGAVDSVRRTSGGGWEGDLTAVDAFKRALRAEGIDAAGARVWLMGAGGVAAAVALSLANCRIGSLTVAETRIGASVDLAACLGHAFPRLAVSVGIPDSHSIDIVVNCVVPGSPDEALLAFDPDRLAPATLVVDAAATRFLSAFARNCSRAGLNVVSGDVMLEHRMNIYDEFFGSGRIPFRKSALRFPETFDA